MKTLTLVVSAVLLSLGVARADNACSADAEKLCAGVMKGEGRVLACLQGNQAQLSPACKQLVGALGGKVNEIGKACGDDVMVFCPNVKTGEGRVLKCLVTNGAKLSETCQKVVQGLEEKSAEFKKGCGGDVSKLCGSVPKGEGRILACLKSKQAELTPACTAVLQPVWALTAVPGAAPVPAPAAAAGNVVAPAAAVPAAAAAAGNAVAPPAVVPATAAPAPEPAPAKDAPKK